MSDVTMDAVELRAAVEKALSLPEGHLGEDDNLFEQGLDSLTLIRLLGRWRRRGHQANFEELAAAPTLAAWQRLLAPADTGASKLVRAPQGPFELATLQHAYWLGREPDQPYGGVAPHFYAELDRDEAVDVDRLAEAVTALFARHDLLRMRVEADGRGRVLDDSPYARLVVHDLRDDPDVGSSLARLRDDYTHRMMDISAGQVLEVGLSLLPRGSRLHWDLDMVAADAFSMRVLLEDLRRLYVEGPHTPLPPIGLSYPDYLATRAAADPRERESARAWWQERLDELPGTPALPVRRGPLDPGVARSRRLHHFVDQQRSLALTRAAQQRGTTLTAVLAAAFSESIGAWCSESRFLLNLPLFQREPIAEDVQYLVGDFSGSVLVPVDLSRPMPLVERAEQVGAALREAIGHSAYSGVEVLRDLGRRAETTTLASVVYTSALGLGDVYSAAVQDAFGRPVWIMSQGPQVWLDAQVTELDGGVLLNWDVRDDILAEGVADAAFEAYRNIVEGLIDDPASLGRPVDVALPVAQRQTRERVNDTAVELPAHTLHGPFFARAAADPERWALVGDRSLSYGELAGRARSVAGWLRSQGAVPGDTVAVTLPKGPDQAAVVLGVLALGCAYLPISVDQPPHRVERIIRIGQPSVHLREDDLTAAYAHPGADPVDTDPRAVAYVLFTSGSTGEPKGVEVSHRAAVNTIESLIARLDMGEEDATLALSALEFDLSVFDLFAPLSVGGRVVTVGEEQRRDAFTWRRLVDEHGVTVWNSVPALLAMLLQSVPSGETLGLRAVLLGGDLVPVDLPEQLRERTAPGCRFVALGGMTEAAIHSTWQEVDADTDLSRGVPWGTPLDNVRCRVVNDRGRDCPDQVAGELWMGGASLAEGYRGAAEATADRFVMQAGERWYRTGDLARYRPDGVLEFLGRRDRQVQLNGFRVEPGEVEAALKAHPEVRDAAVVVDSGSGSLCAVVAVANPGQPPSAEELRRVQADRLPPHMICTRVVPVAEIPLSSNGKVVRDRVLELAAMTKSQQEGRQPETPAERLVARLWAELVEPQRPITCADTFFGIGGDSLLATRVVAALRREGVDGASVAGLLGAGDLAAYAAGLDLAPGDGMAAQPQVRPRPAERSRPFRGTDIQEAYRVGRDPRLPLGGVGTWQYAEFDGPLDAARLERCWLRLVERHEMLRTTFNEDGLIRILEQAPEWSLPVQRVESEAELLELREQYSHRITELTSWPLWDLRVVEHPGGQRLLVGLDYILFDALSIMTLFTELDRLYADPELVMTPIELSFRDYQQQLEPNPERQCRDEAYWRDRLADLPPGPALPLAKPLAELHEIRFERREWLLEAERWDKLRAWARDLRLTPSTLLLTLYAEVLGRWSDEPDLTVTLTMFNRREVHPDIYRVLGDFTTISLADHRHHIEGWLAAAAGLQQRMADDLDHREVSSSWLLRELSRINGRLEAVPVVFTSGLGVGTASEVSMETTGDFPRRVFGISQSPQVSLDNQVTESPSGLLITWDSVRGAFAPGVVDAMFECYTTAVAALVTGGPEAAEQVLSSLPAAQEQTRTEVNRTDRPIQPQLLHQAFVERAARDPEPEALSWWQGGTRRGLSRGELLRDARAVAAGLVAEGVRVGDRIGIRLPKGPDQITAVLAVLLAGAAYVPLGLDLPLARREQIERTAGTRFTIEDLEPFRGAGSEASKLPESVDPGELAYLIFTSGTTGDPKGVQITHEAAWNTIAEVVDRFQVCSDDAVLALAALDFDLSVWDIFGVLGAGGRLVLVAEDERRDAERWAELVHEAGITLWNTVPMLLDMLLLASESKPGALESLRLALVSGDWVGLDLCERLRSAAPTARLKALGGATEASIWSNLQEVDHVPAGWVSVPYGRPLANQRFRVVDSLGRESRPGGRRAVDRWERARPGLLRGRDAHRRTVRRT